MSHAAKMFKQIILHTALLTRMLSIIILIVMPSIPRAVCCFPNILFSTTLAVQEINQEVIITGEFVIYVSPVILLVNMFVSETFTHTSHFFLPHFVDSTTLSNGYD